MSIRNIKDSIARALPTGSPLPEETWLRRHQAILVLLWLHVPGLVAFGVYRDHGLVHSMIEGSLIAVLAAGASISSFGRKSRSALATVGLISSSAILVHFSGGLIEMHFHFFVMVAVVTLYQSWMPFLLAISYVVLHHGLVGLMDSAAVYNHPAAQSSPWKWALIHGMFVAAQSVAGLAAWKLNEIGMDGERKARTALEHANKEFAQAQSLLSIGSWDWDLVRDRVWWSDELFRIFGLPVAEFGVGYEDVLGLFHAEDRDRVQKTVDECSVSGKPFDYEARIVHPDGTVRTIHALGRSALGDDGAVIRMTGTVQDITDRKLLEKRVEHQAFHDALTGLANRALFLDRVDHALLRQQRASSSLAVLFLDLDDFKAVNDSHGHSAGDRLLVDVGHLVSALLRPADTLARLGGDEFAILLEDIHTPADAVLVAERVLELLKRPYLAGATGLSICASIGIAVSSGRAISSAGEILGHADTAMYVAKRHGKASYELFQPEMQVAARNRLQLKADLERAIADEEFVLHYQPIVSLGRTEIKGVEALIRWQHPERGLVPPGDFISFAEETGLIIPIGQWVLREACRNAVRWNKKALGRDPLTVAVNISAVRFRQPGLLEELTEVLEETGLAPELLILEITESVLVHDSDAVVSRLGELKGLGVKLAVDDFGTGYSSLSYLRDFPIDLLKVDKTFIDSVALGAEDSALARAIITLGHTLGLSVVAEGVEEHIQATALQSLGCEYAQGYFFARPLDRLAMDALLSDVDKGVAFAHVHPLDNVAV